MKEVSGIIILGIGFALLLFSLQMLLFLFRRNLLSTVRYGIMVSLIITTLAASHIIDFNPLLGILIIASLLVIHSLASFAAAHWFTHGQMAYVLDDKGITMRLEYKGKDLLVKLLTRRKTFTPWKRYKGMHYYFRPQLIGFDLSPFRTGVPMLLLPSNPQPILRFVRRKIQRHDAHL